MYPSISVVTAKVTYEVDAWFWLPEAAGISASDYDPESFYGNLRTYTRLKTPNVPLAALARISGQGSPLAALELLRQRLTPRGLSSEDRAVLLTETKLLGAILKAAIRRMFRDLGDPEPAALAAAAVTLAEDLESLVATWRTLLSPLQTHARKGITRRALRFCDESVSVQVEQGALGMLKRIEDQPALEETAQRLRQLATTEIAYRTEQEWRTVLGEEQGEPDVAYLDQSQLLKKYTASALHLHTKDHAVDTWARQGASSLAAGLAMFWAVTAQLFMLVALGLQLERGLSAGIVIVFTLLTILSYVLKDRIKVLMGARLAEQLPEWIDDRRRLLLFSKDAPALGQVSERMTFVSQDDVPEDLAAARLASHSTRLVREAKREVLRYRRRVELRPRTAGEAFVRLDGLTDILRLSVWRWVRTLSRARRELLALDADGRVQSRQIPNLYDIDVLVRLQRLDPLPTSEIRQFRIAVNRRGIVSVEDLGDAE